MMFEKWIKYSIITTDDSVYEFVDEIKSITPENKLYLDALYTYREKSESNFIYKDSINIYNDDTDADGNTIYILEFKGTCLSYLEQKEQVYTLLKEYLITFTMRYSVIDPTSKLFITNDRIHAASELAFCFPSDPEQIQSHKEILTSFAEALSLFILITVDDIADAIISMNKYEIQLIVSYMNQNKYLDSYEDSLDYLMKFLKPVMTTSESVENGVNGIYKVKFDTDPCCHIGIYDGPRYNWYSSRLVLDVDEDFKWDINASNKLLKYTKDLNEDVDELITFDTHILTEDGKFILDYTSTSPQNPFIIASMFNAKIVDGFCYCLARNEDFVFIGYNKQYDNCVAVNINSILKQKLSDIYDEILFKSEACVIGDSKYGANDNTIIIIEKSEFEKITSIPGTTWEEKLKNLNNSHACVEEDYAYIQGTEVALF